MLDYYLDAQSLLVTVTFDETKVSIDRIMEELAQGGVPRLRRTTMAETQEGLTSIIGAKIISRFLCT